MLGRPKTKDVVTENTERVDTESGLTIWLIADNRDDVGKGLVAVAVRHVFDPLLIDDRYRNQIIGKANAVLFESANIDKGEEVCMESCFKTPDKGQMADGTSFFAYFTLAMPAEGDIGLLLVELAEKLGSIPLILTSTERPN